MENCRVHVSSISAWVRRPGGGGEEGCAMKKSLDEKTDKERERERERVADIDKDSQRNPDRKRRKRPSHPTNNTGETGKGGWETHARPRRRIHIAERRFERVEREVVQRETTTRNGRRGEFTRGAAG